ncbi:hypothetical protein [Endozoicomonas montiporae]|uniref:hypothetical protein n=1 Tax=Endozoicomonas montiporae TaxID=1027273 RepID=UPI001C9DCD4A|nr:hypothetical protein [Endozoicomonas montiporae]
MFISFLTHAHLVEVSEHSFKILTEDGYVKEHQVNGYTQIWELHRAIRLGLINRTPVAPPSVTLNDCSVWQVYEVNLSDDGNGRIDPNGCTAYLVELTNQDYLMVFDLPLYPQLVNRAELAAIREQSQQKQKEQPQQQRRNRDTPQCLMFGLSFF